MLSKLPEGNYPQSDEKFAYLNSKDWDTKTLLEEHGQCIVEIRFAEMTVESKSSKYFLREELMDMDNDNAYAVFRHPGELGASFFRTSNQSKLSLGTIDVTPDSIVRSEKIIRLVLKDRYDIDNAYHKERLLISHVIFEKDGMPCRWDCVQKGHNGQYLILTKVNNISVSKLSLSEAQGYAEGIATTLCEAKKKVRNISEGCACPYSDEDIIFTR